MPEQTISTEAGDARRDHLLNEVVAFLDQNRDAIIQRFEAEESGGLTREQLEKHGLLDFDVAITLHRDRGGNFGLGSGFFWPRMGSSNACGNFPYVPQWLPHPCLIGRPGATGTPMGPILMIWNCFFKFD